MLNDLDVGRVSLKEAHGDVLISKILPIIFQLFHFLLYFQMFDLEWVEFLVFFWVLRFPTAFPTETGLQNDVDLPDTSYEIIRGLEMR